MDSAAVVMKQRASLFAGWLAIRFIAACVSIGLIVSMTGQASAFDCLAYKPERAIGQWHADVVSGKICWYGPNWRSFLPKPKAHVENSQLANSKPNLKVANTKSVTQAVKSEVENKPDVQIENREPDTQVVKVENSKPDEQIEDSKPDSPVTKVENKKPDGQIENSKSKISAESALPESVDLDSPQKSARLRKATSIEAEEFINAASLDFEPEPAALNPAAKRTREPQGMTSLLVAFSIIAMGTIGLVTLIMRDRSQQDFVDADIEEQPLEHMAIDDELAPPLQPNADEEPVPLEEAKHEFPTQSTY